MEVQQADNRIIVLEWGFVKMSDVRMCMMWYVGPTGKYALYAVIYGVLYRDLTGNDPNVGVGRR